MVAKEANGISMPKIASQDKICEQPSEMQVPPKSNLITPSIVVPLSMVAAFLYWLTNTSAELDRLARADESKNPILDVWIAAPIAASIIYPSGVYFGGKANEESRTI